MLVQMKVRFSKMQALGNDFVVLDNRDSSLVIDAQLAQRIAHRKFGIGCDQLLLIEAPSSADADIGMRIFNTDGSEAGHCGNGARAVARYAVHRGLVEQPLVTMELPGGYIRAAVNAQDGLVTVDMGAPDFLPEHVPFVADERAKLYTVSDGMESISFGAVTVGNPHAVIEVTSTAQFELERVGKLLQAHERFPEGVNVGAAEVVDEHTVRLRVYERGVGETLACGTGACAALAVLRDRGRVAERVELTLPGGTLTMAWAGPGESIWMTGPAEFVFDGEISL
jgi:diaminopimelate epimerase